MQSLLDLVNNSIYFFQAGVALWGLYCAVMVWTRINQIRFKNFETQSEFLDALETPLARGEFELAAQLCEGDRRAVCQLAHVAIANRQLGLKKARDLVRDHFQREILSDLEHRLGGISIAIKTEPMLGLLGTVLGMMAAFAKLGASSTVKAEDLAADISFALVTTAVGLAVSIPLMFVLTSINVRMRKMEELAVVGIGRFLEQFESGMKAAPPRGR